MTCDWIQTGLMEDTTARIAFKETQTAGRKVEPELWTLRALIPALATFLHPLVAWKYLDGELKGGETAMAAKHGRPIQVCYTLTVNVIA